MSEKLEIVFVINDPVVGLGLLRTAKLCGYKVNVVARTGCRWLRWTAACQRFIEVDETEIATNLLSVLRERGFDNSRFACLAAGDISTKALIEIAPDLKARTQHSMDSEAREVIGNKASFAQICKKVGVPTPLTWVVSEKDELAGLIGDASFAFPVIVKAVNMSGSIGIRTAANQRELTDIIDDDSYDFSPLVVQKYVDGYDVGFSCIVENGQVRSGYTQKRTTRGDSFPLHVDFLKHVQTLCEAVNYSGPANIDARIDNSGNIYIIECNARFWATSALSYLLGLDLIAEGHQPSSSKAEVLHYHDNTLFSFGNALKGLLSLGPMESDKAKRYFRSVYTDIPAFIFTKVPASRKFFAI